MEMGNSSTAPADTASVNVQIHNLRVFHESVIHTKR